jgi:hypothetical protein
MKPYETKNKNNRRKENQKMKNIAIKALDTLRESTEKGCKFLTFLYQSKGTGEVAKYQINFGISYHAACEADKALIEGYTPANEIEAEAKAEMLKSLTETLTEGVSSSYTQKDTFENIGKGISQHKETGEIYIYGFVQSKQQIEPPTTPKKDVNSSAKTIAKRTIEKALECKRNKFAKFVLNPENIGGIKVCGEVIELHP